ncbi:hypothetical protein [Treponema sp. R6D11]
MDEVENINDIPSTSSLSKLGITAISYIAGGIFLFLLNIISKFRVFGLVVGGIVCLVGIGSLFSKDPADKRAGLLITTVGALTILSKSRITFLVAVCGTLLSIGSVGLLVLGIINGIKFLIGLKKRS